MATSVVEKFVSMEYGPAAEDAGEAIRWLEAHGRRFGSGGSETFDTRNPATGELLAAVAEAGDAEVEAAVRRARAALPGWQALRGHQRARYLYALARQVQKHARRLAVLETLDNGKPIRESRDIDIPLAARHFYHHAGWAQLLGTLDAEGGGFSGEAFRGYVPVGVVGAIIPWNFPLLMFAWKVAPALAAGCTVVIKPAEYTPLTALAMAEIAEEIGLPEGVLNVVTGDGRTGKLLAEHPDVDKVAFTGSTEVGRLIRRATAGSTKRLTLELGGKSPFLVFDDADLDSAVEGVVDGIWFNQGQVCCAGSRLLVQERVAERFYAKLRARMATLRVGSPLDKTVDIGAIADRVQFDRIERYIETGVREGATCWQPQMTLPAEGLFLKPTLLTGVAPASTVAQEEIFGPVLAAMTFRTPAEAVELAYNTVYGLAASVWSENINVALDVASAVKAGVVWVNGTNLFDAACGFGGYRESGYGREGGQEGMFAYLQPTWVKGAGEDGLPVVLPEPVVGSEFGAPRSVDGPTGEQQIPLHPSEQARRGPRFGDDSQKGNDNDKSNDGGNGNGNGSVLSVEGLGASDGTQIPFGNDKQGGDEQQRLNDDRNLLGVVGIDRTVKQYIGGKQVRPDSGYSFAVRGFGGELLGHAPLGSRKDVRNAVEAARAAAGKWARQTAHGRAQVLYFLAENLQQRREGIVQKLAPFTGEAQAAVEFDFSVERAFTYAAWCDKFDGAVHSPPMKMVALAMHEPVGVVGVLAGEEAPLLGLLSLVLPAVAMGNAVVAVPDERASLLMAELYQVLDTSDVPGGVVNLLAGRPMELGKTLAEHDDVDAIWSFRDDAAATMVKTASAGNLKQTWTNHGHAVDWFDPAQGEGRLFLRHATQVKNVWVPYGE